MPDQVVPDQIVPRHNSHIRAIPLQMVLADQKEEPRDLEWERMSELRRLNRSHVRFEEGESSSKWPRTSYKEMQLREQQEAQSVTTQPRGRLRIRATARKRMVYPNKVHMRNQPYCELCEGVGHWTRNCWRTSLRRMLSPEHAECDSCGMRGHFTYRCPNPEYMRHWRPCDTCGMPIHLNNHCWRARPDRPLFTEPSRCTECGGGGHFPPSCPYRVVRERSNPSSQLVHTGENPLDRAIRDEEDPMNQAGTLLSVASTSTESPAEPQPEELARACVCTCEECTRRRNQ
ncbi:PREDICTED: uncharacterized protein LOC104698848 [Camelina sativa]|uniref:Uncharacterized protein LOC104698848 n=1 Tax=Camelina sativa TaxID=90675 RepID=A0ABM0SKN1_CAMSA|nr:PREDICTED: uncharacterized protein LOC104698848 [Camelina sativa]